MWTNEQSIETAASPEAVWRLWSDVATWPEWNADIEHIEISGSFAAGSTITMTPIGQDPVELQIVEAVEPELFVDEAELAAVVVRTIHRVEELGRQPAPDRLSDGDQRPGSRHRRPGSGSQHQRRLPRDPRGAR